MTKVHFTIRGCLVGPIWWPTRAECFKHFTYNLTREAKRFTESGGKATLRDHVLHLLMEQGGDFQHCELGDADLVAKTYHKEGETLVERTRWFPLDMFPSVADCVRADWCPPSMEEDYA